MFNQVRPYRLFASLLGVALTLLACAQPYSVKPSRVIAASPTPSSSGSTPPLGANVGPPPSCLPPCETVDDQQIANYTIELQKQGKFKEALLFLEECKAQCPKFACPVAKAYHNYFTQQEGVSGKENSHTLFHLIGQCNHNPPENFSEEEQIFFHDLWKEADTQVKGPKYRTAGWALIGTGIALTITSIVLGIFSEKATFLGPNTCVFRDTFGNDPCFIDLRGFYIPVGITGLGALGAGIGLVVHYRF